MRDLKKLSIFLMDYTNAELITQLLIRANTSFTYTSNRCIIISIETENHLLFLNEISLLNLSPLISFELDGKQIDGYGECK